MNTNIAVRTARRITAAAVVACVATVTFASVASAAAPAASHTSSAAGLNPGPYNSMSEDNTQWH